MSDVVVVGAGSAGSTLAYSLAQHGIDGSLVEKSQLLRVKPCESGLDDSFFNYVPEDVGVDPLVQGRAREIEARYEGAHRPTSLMPPQVAMTEHSQLNHFLLMEGQEMDVRVRQGARMERVDRRSDGTYEVRASGETIRACVAVQRLT